MSVEKQTPQPAQNLYTGDPRWEDSIWKETPAESMGLPAPADIQDAREKLRQDINGPGPVSTEVSLPAMDSDVTAARNRVDSPVYNMEVDAADPILSSLTTSGKIAYIRGLSQAARAMQNSQRDTH